MLYLKAVKVNPKSYPLNLHRAVYQSYFNKSEEKNKDDQKDMSDLHARNLF